MATDQGTIYFSDKPFTTKTTGSKQQFKSSDFIYARLEVPSSIEQFFGMPATSNKRDYPASVMLYNVRVEPDPNPDGDRPCYNSWPYIKLTNEQKKSNFLNFDVLPEPSEATTMTCGVPEFTSGIASAPLYSMFNKECFPRNGKYKVTVKIQYWTFDPYDPDTPASESEWITCTGELELNFEVKDIASLQANGSKAKDLAADNAKKQTMNERGLPKEWNMKSAPIANGFTEKELTTMFLAREGATCKAIKMVVYPDNGQGWIVVKNQNTGQPEWKWHNQTLGFFAENNGRYFYIIGGLRQQHSGGGQYEPAYFQYTESTELNGKFIEEALAGEKGSKSKAKK